jgi:hypothetical protein
MSTEVSFSGDKEAETLPASAEVKKMESTHPVPHVFTT